MRYVSPYDIFIQNANIYLSNCYVSPDGMFTIDTKGNVTIKRSFEWNGATLWREGKLTTIQDANGILLPYSWRATAQHDACYKYLASDITFPLTRLQCDQMLKNILERYNCYSFIERNVIYYAVRALGGLILGTQGSKPLIQTSGFIRLGSPYIVRNSHRVGNEGSAYVWIKIQNSDSTDERWVALTQKQIASAEKRAIRNIKDKPTENKLFDLLT